MGGIVGSMQLGGNREMQSYPPPFMIRNCKISVLSQNHAWHGGRIMKCNSLLGNCKSWEEEACTGALGVRIIWYGP